MKTQLLIFFMAAFLFGSHQVFSQNQKTKSAESQAVNDGEYTGKYRKGLRHGFGVCVWPDGSRYEGQWRYGTMTGKGTFTFKGNKYVGMWLNGKKHGQGKLVYADGSVYEGEFKNDKKHGYGKLKTLSGEEHTGEWANDMSNGYGKHVWASGTTYVGDWKNNQMHGNGVLMYFDGRVEQGKFVDNEYVPCECGPMATVEQAFNDARGVFVGRVVELYSGESGDYDEIIMEIEQLWKGEHGYGRRIFLKAGYSSCDEVFYEDEAYLIYAQVGTDGMYFTTKCTRTTELVGAEWEIEQLDQLVRCKDPNQIKPGFASSENDPVCGCDGEDYRNPSRANKAGLTAWKKGKCSEWEEKE